MNTTDVDATIAARMNALAKQVLLAMDAMKGTKTMKSLVKSNMSSLPFCLARPMSTRVQVRH